MEKRYTKKSVVAELKKRVGTTVAVKAENRIIGNFEYENVLYRIKADLNEVRNIISCSDTLLLTRAIDRQLEAPVDEFLEQWFINFLDSLDFEKEDLAGVTEAEIAEIKADMRIKFEEQRKAGTLIRIETGNIVHCDIPKVDGIIVDEEGIAMYGVKYMIGVIKND